MSTEACGWLPHQLRDLAVRRVHPAWPRRPEGFAMRRFFTSSRVAPNGSGFHHRIAQVDLQARKGAWRLCLYAGLDTSEAFTSWA